MIEQYTIEGTAGEHVVNVPITLFQAMFGKVLKVKREGMGHDIVYDTPETNQVRWIAISRKLVFRTPLNENEKVYVLIQFLNI